MKVANVLIEIEIVNGFIDALRDNEKCLNKEDREIMINCLEHYRTILKNMNVVID